MFDVDNRLSYSKMLSISSGTHTHKHTLLKVQGTRDLELPQQKLFEFSLVMWQLISGSANNNKEISSKIYVINFP